MNDVKYPELPAPDSYLFQHDETGLTQYVDAQQVEWGFEAINPRLRKVSGAYSESQMRSYADATCALRGGQQGWASIHEARPPCDGETMFIGENEAGYIACFNRLTPDGYCFHDTAESEICVMSGLRMWKLVDRPFPPPSTHPQETQP